MVNSLEYLKQLSKNEVCFIYRDIKFYPCEADGVIDFIIESSKNAVCRDTIISQPKHRVKSLYEEIQNGIDNLEYSLDNITEKTLNDCIEFIMKSNLNYKGFYINQYYKNCDGIGEQKLLFKYLFETAKIKLQIKNMKDNVNNNIGYLFQ